MTDKKVLTLQDISCFGQCSITVALPIISACGIETAVLPSAVLSTHTGGFVGFTFRDLTEDILGIIAHWKKEGIKFDCLYTGYLGNISQVEYAKVIRRELLNDGAKLIVDPAMADNGVLYNGFDDSFVKGMRKLCAQADIMLPNLTEAALMTGIEFKEENHTEKYIDDMLTELGKIGAKMIILKGISFEKNKIGIVVAMAMKLCCLITVPAAVGMSVMAEDTREKQFYFTERMDKNSPGTGDCFASAFTGALMRGKSEYESATIAADFVRECIKNTIDDESHVYGVKFEKAIPMLVNRCNGF